MPYSTVSDLPKSVREAIPSENGKKIFMNVFNSQLEAGKSETVAFASAWSTLQRDGYEKNSEGQYIKKREINDDAFTLEQEASVRSSDLGFQGATHTHETSDGQKVFMPAESHDEYLGVDSGSESMLRTAISAIINTIMRKSVNPVGIVKIDEDQKIVYGWASVVTEKGEVVTDRQGDIISPDDMEKMATDFMMSARVAKAMHDGDGIGEVVHSMPMTKSIAKSFGINTDREGWMIAMKVHDEEVWKRVKSGELKAFSIGGQAVKEDYNG